MRGEGEGGSATYETSDLTQEVGRGRVRLKGQRDRRKNGARKIHKYLFKWFLICFEY